MKNGIPRIAAIVPVVFTFIAAFILLTTSHVSAGSGPKIVRGWIWDSAKNPLENANVVVTIKYPDTTVRASDSDLADENGFYSVIFTYDQWDTGDTIEVTANYKGNILSNSTGATDYPTQYVNVTYAFEIDQLGGWIGFVAAGGIVGAVAIVLLVRRRKQ